MIYLPLTHLNLLPDARAVSKINMYERRDKCKRISGLLPVVSSVLSREKIRVSLWDKKAVRQLSARNIQKRQGK